MAAWGDGGVAHTSIMPSLERAAATPHTLAQRHTASLIERSRRITYPAMPQIDTEVLLARMRAALGETRLEEQRNRVQTCCKLFRIRGAARECHVLTLVSATTLPL